MGVRSEGRGGVSEGLSDVDTEEEWVRWGGRGA